MLTQLFIKRQSDGDARRNSIESEAGYFILSQCLKNETKLYHDIERQKKKESKDRKRKKKKKEIYSI